jgi:hypothetical protein
VACCYTSWQRLQHPRQQPLVSFNAQPTKTQPEPNQKSIKTHLLCCRY